MECETKAKFEHIIIPDDEVNNTTENIETKDMQKEKDNN